MRRREPLLRDVRPDPAFLSAPAGTGSGAQPEGEESCAEPHHQARDGGGRPGGDARQHRHPRRRDELLSCEGTFFYLREKVDWMWISEAQMWVLTLLVDLVRTQQRKRASDGACLNAPGGRRAGPGVVGGVWGGPAPPGSEEEGRDPAGFTSRARAGPAAAGRRCKRGALQDTGTGLVAPATTA